jgi:hypothetical protein
MTGSDVLCTSCGAVRRSDDRFCRSCGRAFETAGPVALPPRPAAAAAGPVLATVPAVPTVPGAGGKLSSLPVSVRGRPGSSSLSAVGRGVLGCLAVFVLLGVVGLVGAFLSGELDGSPRPTIPGAIATAPHAPTAPVEATPVQVTLADALAEGLIEMQAAGVDLQELSLSLDSLADEPLDIVVPAGVVFEPASGSTQPMVVIRESVISLEPGGSTDWILDVACASMELDQPDEADAFAISTAATPRDLAALLALPSFADADFRVQQFAVWTITDDPTRDGYVGLGSFGFGNGPDDDEIAQIKALFEQSGIDTADYRALR